MQLGILPCSKYSAYGIQGQLHSCITVFLHYHSQRVALNGTLSSPLPAKAGAAQWIVLGPMLFIIFISDPIDSLEHPCYLFADDSTLCRDISTPSDRQAASSLFPLLKPCQNHKLVKHIFAYVSILSTLCILVCLSPSTYYFLPPPCCWIFPFLLLFPSLCCVLICSVSSLFHEPRPSN